MMGRLLDCRHLCGEMTMEARVALAHYLYKQEQIDTAHMSALSGGICLGSMRDRRNGLRPPVLPSYHGSVRRS